MIKKDLCIIKNSIIHNKKELKKKNFLKNKNNVFFLENNIFLFLKNESIYVLNKSLKKSIFFNLIKKFERKKK